MLSVSGHGLLIKRDYSMRFFSSGFCSQIISTLDPRFQPQNIFLICGTFEAVFTKYRILYGDFCSQTDNYKMLVVESGGLGTINL